MSASNSRVQLHTLLPIVYDELRRYASAALDSERADHSFQTTELLHEAYLRLARIDRIEWSDEDHLMRAAIGVMRRVLIDHARARNAQKRDKAAVLLRGPTDAFAEWVEPAPDLELIALDEALNKLEQFDPRKAEVVELRYFGNRSVEDVARMQGVSPATVKRDWTLARAWLSREMHLAAQSQ